MLARPERIGVDADVILRTLDGRLKISPDGTMRRSSRYLLVGREGAARPEPAQAAWLYAQMVRWGRPRSAQRRSGSPRGVQAGSLRRGAGTARGRGPAAFGSVGAFAGPVSIRPTSPIPGLL